MSADFPIVNVNGEKNVNDALKRQREYQARKLKKGYIRTCAWIPERDLERVRTYVARLNRAFEREQGGRR